MVCEWTLAKRAGQEADGGEGWGEGGVNEETAEHIMQGSRVCWEAEALPARHRPLGDSWGASEHGLTKNRTW